MSVPGNKNAEKWTKDKVQELQQKAIHILKNETTEDGEKSYPVFFINTLTRKLGVYRTLWYELQEKFADDKAVIDTFKEIDNLLEENLYMVGMTGTCNSTLTVFGLKNKFNWKDKKETDITSNGQTLPTSVHLIVPNEADYEQPEND